MKKNPSLGYLFSRSGSEIIVGEYFVWLCGTWISSFRVMLPAYQATQNKQKIVEHEYDGDLKI